jgi:hypothetical protein
MVRPSLVCISVPVFMCMLPSVNCIACAILCLHEALHYIDTALLCPIGLNIRCWAAVMDS